MNRNAVHKFGDFGNQILFTPFRVTTECLRPTNDLLNLPMCSMILWGSFCDDQGDTYTLVREMPGYSTNGLWVQSTRDAKALHMMKECANAWKGSLALEINGARAEWTSGDIYSRKDPAFRLDFNDGKIAYEEKDFVKLTATEDGYGYQFFDPTSRQGSVDQAYNATGTIAGRKVTGWLGMNPHYQPSGINYRISPMAIGKLMITWIHVCTIFEDGSWEMGPVIIGRNGYSFAMITNDKGQVSRSSNIKAKFNLGEDRFPITFDVSYVDDATGEKMEWEWKIKDGTKMVDLPALAPYLKYKRSSEGTFLRKGENRKVKHSSAWPEFQADDRVELFHAEQTA